MDLHVRYIYIQNTVQQPGYRCTFNTKDYMYYTCTKGFEQGQLKHGLEFITDNFSQYDGDKIYKLQFFAYTRRNNETE